MFTTLFALGLVLISVTPSQTDLNHIIFGNILGVSTADLSRSPSWPPSLSSSWCSSAAT